MKTIFLGGTCNNSKWRDNLIPHLSVGYFNPVVKDWTPECQAEEIRQRQICDYVLYTITPLMKGVYSIAEAVDDSNKRPDKTILCLLRADWLESERFDFDDGQWKSLRMVASMVEGNGGKVFYDLEDVASALK